MHQRTLSQSTRLGNIFGTGQIGMHLAQQMLRTMQSGAPVHSSINRWMVVHILAIINGCFLDLANGPVDLADRNMFIIQFPLIHIVFA